VNPAGYFDSFAFDLHESPVEKVNSDQLGGPIRRDPCPNRLDRRAVGQILPNLNHWIWVIIRPFTNHYTLGNTLNHLPNHNRSIAQLLIRMNTDYDPIVGYRLSNSSKQVHLLSLKV
jgi:hypothetical protein